MGKEIRKSEVDKEGADNSVVVIKWSTKGVNKTANASDQHD